ncbi:MAG: PilZ domain-containing protein [Endomicrobia bacterium]|nr:PilZ domain-containing protein [Endomicrobiia bacterium]
MVEKRKNRRMPIIKQFGELIMLKVAGESVPGIILDLSADGVSLMAYAHVPTGTSVCLDIDLPDLKAANMCGKVVWSLKQGEMWRMGISVTDMSTLDAKQINRMAIAFNDCENKIMLGVPDVCYSKCSYYKICEKPQKIKGEA